MKKIFVGLLVLGSISAMASEFTCTATLDSAGAAQAKQLENLAGKVYAASIESFSFNVTQTNDETIVLSVFNRAKRSQAATATTFIPKKGQPSNLNLRLEDGAAVIDCEAL